MTNLSDKERVESVAERCSQPDRFRRAIAQFDLLNDDDPKRVRHEHRDVGYELYFSRILFGKTIELEPEASEALSLASRCQHVCRWMIPREDYTRDRAGYLKWRSDLKKFHAAKAKTALEEIGYDPQTVDRVQRLNLKKDLNSDPECQSLEDALCLVFLETQFADLIEKTERDKMIGILQKTWKKMGEKGRERALAISYPSDQEALVREAVSSIAS